MHMEFIFHVLVRQNMKLQGSNVISPPRGYWFYSHFCLNFFSETTVCREDKIVKNKKTTTFYRKLSFLLVGEAGLEPARPQ